MGKNRTHLSWENREQDLKKMKRYGNFSVMFYRSNLHLHSQRVGALLERIIPLAKKLYPDLDIKKARLIAKHHDDYELRPEIGDVPLQLKLMMNDQELSHLEKKEIWAAEAMAQFYPKKVGGYNYLQLLLHAIHKDCIEAQLVSVADKNDGCCEAIHEVLAGNTIFLEPIINYHAKTFSNFSSKYPLVEKIFSSDHSLLSVPVVDLKLFFANGNRGAEPHTLQTIIRKTDIPRYEEWKRTTIKNFGMDPLIRQTEFHNA